MLCLTGANWLNLVGVLELVSLKAVGMRLGNPLINSGIMKYNF